MTSSQVVWAIDELVRLICSQILEYRFSVYLQHDMIHDDLVLDPNSRRMLARCVLYLNRSISRIAVKLLWKELGSLDPLCALFPVDYLQRNEAEYVSCLYRRAHWTTVERRGAIDMREGRNSRRF